MIARESRNLEGKEIDKQRGGPGSPPVTDIFVGVDFSDPALYALVNEPSLPLDLSSFDGSHSGAPGNG